MAPAHAAESNAFAPGKTGHAGWHELHARDNRAALAFSLGALEWIVWRLHKMLPDDGVFQFLDAVWAGLVDWRYLDAFIDRPWEETFDREVGSPMEAAISRLELAFANARDGTAFFDQPVTISEVALRVCGVPEAFKAWRVVPAPRVTITITAATPMMMPSTVRPDRRTLRWISRIAIRTVLPNITRLFWY